MILAFHAASCAALCTFLSRAVAVPPSFRARSGPARPCLHFTRGLAWSDLLSRKSRGCPAYISRTVWCGPTTTWREARRGPTSISCKARRGPIFIDTRLGVVVLTKHARPGALLLTFHGRVLRADFMARKARCGPAYISRKVRELYLHSTHGPAWPYAHFKQGVVRPPIHPSTHGLARSYSFPTQGPLRLHLSKCMFSRMARRGPTYISSHTGPARPYELRAKRSCPGPSWAEGQPRDMTSASCE